MSIITNELAVPPFAAAIALALLAALPLATLAVKLSIGDRAMATETVSMTVTDWPIAFLD